MIMPQPSTRLESDTVIIVPYKYLIDVGGTIRSVAVKFNTGNFIKQIEDFMTRIESTLFVGFGQKSYVYSSTGVTALGGLGNLVVPISIAALIVLNTMMGSVFERFKEIHIYSSVGLAPVHISALFLAESCVYAIMGAIIGYLLGQVTGKIVFETGIMSGLSLNYSSTSTVFSTVLVMATVLLSSIYPAKKAAAMAVPDITRKWIVSEPTSDDWEFLFPFTVAGFEVLALFAYLREFFSSYEEESVGNFYSKNVIFSANTTAIGEEYIITMLNWLAPFDLGVSQKVLLKALPTGEHNIYKIQVNLTRLTGDRDSWIRVNRSFLDVLRKRFLVWRTISTSIREEFKQDGINMLHGKKGNI